VKDENGDMLVDSHNVMKKWNIYFNQLLNVHGVIDVRQMHTAEPLVRRTFGKLVDWRPCTAVNAEGGGNCYAKL